MHYYPECKEEYNLYGEYEINCENNLFDWKDVKKVIKKKPDPFELKKCLNCN